MQDWYTGGLGGPVDVVGSSNQVIVNAEESVVQVYNELEINPPTFESDPIFIPVQSFTHGGDEIEQYWFHPDHLGSSNYITNLAGEVSQHMEYFAFGETFVEEHRSSNNSPYKFNGKELDEETGWYYYGARYYDPRISVWLSVDPLASYDPINNYEHYIDGEHNGGVFNAKNLNVYGYCYQNPIAYIDPNGKQIFISDITVDQIKNEAESIDDRTQSEKDADTRGALKLLDWILPMEASSAVLEGKDLDGNEVSSVQLTGVLILAVAKPGKWLKGIGKGISKTFNYVFGRQKLSKYIDNLGIDPKYLSGKNKIIPASKNGNYQTALDDFNSIKGLKNKKKIQTDYGDGWSGELKDGTTVSVRPGRAGKMDAQGDRTGGGSVLQINQKDGKSIKTEYNE